MSHDREPKRRWRMIALGVFVVIVTAMAVSARAAAPMSSQQGVKVVIVCGWERLSSLPQFPAFYAERVRALPHVPIPRMPDPFVDWTAGYAGPQPLQYAPWSESLRPDVTVQSRPVVRRCRPVVVVPDYVG